MDWTSCKKSVYVKEIKPDHNLANALINASQKKTISNRMLMLTDDTAASKISLAYDALRELLEAWAVIKGYKIYNHECYSSFLKEVLNESRLGDQFDGFRKIRNDINYYGKDVLASEAKPLLKEIAIIAEIINKKLNEKRP